MMKWSMLFLGLAWSAMAIGSGLDDKPRSSYCVLGMCAALPAESNTFMIAPYLWAPAIKGGAELLNNEAKFDYSAEDLASGINAGAMGFLLWHRGSDFFYLEALGIRHKDRISAFQNKLVKSQLAMAEVGYGRRLCVGGEQMLTECRLSVSPYFGLRQSQLDLAIQLNEGGLEAELLALMGIPDRLTADERWVDPTAGFYAQWLITDQLQLYTKLDAAGFDLGYNRYWSAMTVMEYRWSEHWSIAGGYRISDFEAEPGGDNDLKMRLKGRGPLAGVIYSF